MNENETILSLDPHQIFLKSNPTIQLKNLWCSPKDDENAKHITQSTYTELELELIARKLYALWSWSTLHPKQGGSD